MTVHGGKRAVPAALVGRREAARRCGIAPRTLLRWEREGLIAPQRTAGGEPVFGEHELGRIALIRTLRDDLGVNLAGIAVVLDLRDRLAELQERHRRLRAAFEAGPPGERTVGQALVRSVRPCVVPWRPRGIA